MGAAFDLAVHIEKIERNFSRYHKYTLGTELRQGSQGSQRCILEANECRERTPHLEQLRKEIESWSDALRRRFDVDSSQLGV